jgi:hypothetical protein
LLDTYVKKWVREFFASVWVALDHNYIHYALVGTDYKVTAQHSRETWGLTASEIKIHELCYAGIEPPCRNHDGELPPVDFISPFYCPPFSEGSSRAVGGLTHPARILDFVMRKTMLPRPGYHEGFTRI